MALKAIALVEIVNKLTNGDLMGQNISVKVSVGHNDLGPNIPPMPGQHPAFPSSSEGGGNLVGSGHPMFRERFEGVPPGVPPSVPPSVPPGARFDSFGPGVPQPFGVCGRGFDFGRPNNDHLRMPGTEDDF